MRAGRRVTTRSRWLALSKSIGASELPLFPLTRRSRNQRRGNKSKVDSRKSSWTLFKSHSEAHEQRAKSR
jgi:hypothetical protein